MIFFTALRTFKHDATGSEYVAGLEYPCAPQNKDLATLLPVWANAGLIEIRLSRVNGVSKMRGWGVVQ